jgi:hypothetical protein
MYYKRRDQARAGIYDARPAPGVYSDRINNVGRHGREGEYVAVPPQQANYGTVGVPPPQ